MVKLETAYQQAQTEWQREAQTSKRLAVMLDQKQAEVSSGGLCVMY